MEKEMSKKAASSGEGGNRKMLAPVKAYLQKFNFAYTLVDNKSLSPQPTIILIKEHDHGSYRCQITMLEEQERFHVMATIPIKIPVEHRPAVAEFIARANHNILIGHFSIGFSDGDVRFQHMTDIKGSCLSQEMVRQVLGVCSQTADQYLPGFVAVCYAGKTPKDAFEAIQSNDGDSRRESGRPKGEDELAATVSSQ